MTGSTTSMGTLIAAAARYRIGHVRAIDERSALRCPGALHIDQALGTADNPMTDSLTASAFSSTGTSRTVPGTIVTVLVRSRHVDLIPIRRHVSKAVLAMLVGNGLLAESGPRKGLQMHRVRQIALHRSQLYRPGLRFRQRSCTARPPERRQAEGSGKRDTRSR